MDRTHHLTLALALAAGSLLVACDSSTTVLEGEGGGGGGDPRPGVGPGPGPGPGPSGGGGEAPGCTSNQQCIDDNGGLPYVCGDGACSPLLSAACTEILGNVDALADEGVVVIGVMAPLSGPEAARGRQQVDAIALALDELDAVAGGVPVDGMPAPVVATVCDEVPAPEAAAAHLVDVVGVSLILGPSGADAVATVSAGTSVPSGVVVLSPSADGPDLHLLDDTGLTWQAASVARHGEAMAAVAARVEAGLPAGQHRLALVVEADDTRMEAVADAFFATVILNGRSGPDGVSAGDLIRLAIPAGDPTAAAAAIVELDADLVVVAGQPLGALVDAVEPVAADPPTWIAGPGSDAAAEVAGLLGDRLFVVQTGPSLDRSAFDAFAIRHASATGEAPIFAAGEAYDAAYVGLLALAAAGSAVADGRAVAASLPRLIGAGPRITVGPASLHEALAALASGGEIDLVGTTGSLDADLATGTSPRSHAILCVSGGELVASGVVSGEDGELAGTSTCL